MQDSQAVIGFLVFFAPLAIAVLIVNYPSQFTPFLGVVMFYAGGAALFLPFLGIAIAASLIGSAIIVLVFSGAIAAMERRMEALAAEARLSRRVLLRLAHPEVPWPPMDPDEVALEEWRGDRLWRMRADGRWEYKDGKRWISRRSEG